MEDFLKDVPLDSSPDTEAEIEVEPVEDVIETDVEAGEDDSKGRTIENSHRELSRKQDEFQAKITKMFLDSQEKLVEALRPREPEKKTGNTLDDMSVSELDTLRVQVAEANPDKLSEFDSYLNQRKSSVLVESKMADWESRQAKEQLRGDAQREALRRYHVLSDRSSDFYQAVNEHLNGLGADYVKSNPRAVLDAANDVAAQMGVSPSQVRNSAAIRGRIANKGNSGPAAGAPSADDSKGRADREAIAKRLRGALPAGKDFDKKSLEDRVDYYKKNSQYYLKG